MIISFIGIPHLLHLWLSKTSWRFGLTKYILFVNLDILFNYLYILSRFTCTYHMLIEILISNLSQLLILSNVKKRSDKKMLNIETVTRVFKTTFLLHTLRKHFKASSNWLDVKTDMFHSNIGYLLYRLPHRSADVSPLFVKVRKHPRWYKN